MVNVDPRASMHPPIVHNRRKRNSHPGSASVLNQGLHLQSNVITAECVVRRTEVLPVIGRGERGRCVGVHYEHDREPGLQVEIDVAVEEPWPRIVRLQAHEVSSCSSK